MQPRALVLQAYGTNRDLDLMDALTLAGALPTGVPLNDLRAGKKHFADFQMLVIPGGFSYADALGAGLLLAIDLNTFFAEEIHAFIDSGKPVLGICNGFQALLKSGVLPGMVTPSRNKDRKDHNKPERRKLTHSPLTEILHGSNQATLTFNKCGHFECRWIFMRPISQKCVWTKGLQDSITCPVAHGEGNFQTRRSTILSMFQSQDQIAFTYVHADGTPANGEYPINPNGSTADIAGICNPQGNVLGLMPHPENHIHPWQHPRRSRNETGGSGLVLFENGVKYAKA